MFALNQRDDKGISIREHLESVRDQTGIVPPRLAEMPELPMPFLWHWNAYIDLSNGRTQNGWGLSPLSWQDIAAWAGLRRYRLGSLDIDILQALDVAYVEVYSAAQEKRQEQRDLERKGGF